MSPRSGVKRPRLARSQRSGLFRAPARATFVCGDKSSQKHRLDLRSKNPSRAILSCDFPHLLAGIAFCHRCRIKGLCLRSPARRLTRPLAPATVGVFCSYRRSGRGYFAPRARERVSDGSLLSTATKVTKSAGRNCVSALPQRAMPVRCRPRFSSRNRRFPDRCRSPDCASTAFRCRCLLLRQKLFVLPCRRLRNNYTPCPTGTPTFAALRRQRRDLIIAKNDQRTNPYPHCCQRQRRKRYKRSLNRQCYPLHFMRECTPPNLHLPAPRQGTLRP